ERPIRRWKRAHKDIPNIGRCRERHCGGAGDRGDRRIERIRRPSLAQCPYRYGTGRSAGQENGCRMSNYPDVPAGCFDASLALLIGDSLAGSLFGSFAHGFNDLGLKLLYMGQEGCDPLLLVPSERERLRQGPCAKLLVPFDLLLSKPSAIVSVVVTPRMSGRN